MVISPVNEEQMPGAAEAVLKVLQSRSLLEKGDRYGA